MSKRISCRQAINQALAAALEGHEDRVRRPAADWRPPKGLRDHGKLTLHAARHLYTRYPVPVHLEEVWLRPPATALAAENAARHVYFRYPVPAYPDEAWLRAAANAFAAENAERKRWYLAVAQGRSLYDVARDVLSRAETHLFVTLSGFTCFDRALWTAVALGYGADDELARCIGASRISRLQSDTGWRRELTQFFANHPATTAEIDDLCDYLCNRRAEDRAFRLEGRTLPALRRQTHEWHAQIARAHTNYMLQRQADKLGSRPVRWQGAQLKNWQWWQQHTSKLYVIRQLHSAQELMEESHAMQHCVATYADRCVAGLSSIWGLLCETDGSERLLTIELDQRHRAVQIRGARNRLATPDEMVILRRWARERRVTLQQ